MKNKRILLKLSGEALKGKENNFDLNTINVIANQVIELNKKNYEIAIVIGGGNIWRGGKSTTKQIDRVNSDYIGMLATVMNSIFFSKILNNISDDISYVFSKLEVKDLTLPFIIEDIKSKLKSQKILLLAGGTGSAFFTTDTTSVLRALEIEADILLMAKNGVDGIYDSDPNVNKNAKFIQNISYREIINKNITIIDETAASLAKGKSLKTVIFDINKKNSIYDIVTNKKIKHSIIQ